MWLLVTGEVFLLSLPLSLSLSSMYLQSLSLLTSSLLLVCSCSYQLYQLVVGLRWATLLLYSWYTHTHTHTHKRRGSKYMLKYISTSVEDVRERGRKEGRKDRRRTVVCLWAFIYVLFYISSLLSKSYFMFSRRCSLDFFLPIDCKHKKVSLSLFVFSLCYLFVIFPLSCSYVQYVHNRIFSLWTRKRAHCVWFAKVHIDHTATDRFSFSFVFSSLSSSFISYVLSVS